MVGASSQPGGGRKPEVSMATATVSTPAPSYTTAYPGAVPRVINYLVNEFGGGHPASRATRDGQYNRRTWWMLLPLL